MEVLKQENVFWKSEYEKTTVELDSIKLVVSKQLQIMEEHHNLFKKMVLDVTQTVCNICGYLLNGETWILNYCGAVSSS